MKYNKKRLFLSLGNKTIYLFISLIMSACHSDQSSLSEIPNLRIRVLTKENTSISLQDDIESIEYIPLETNDSCLISNLLNLQVSEDFLFMYNGKSGKILQFDRKGKFIRQISSEGKGPGEYGLVSDLGLNSSKRELFIIQYNAPTLVYSFGGVFLRNDTTMKKASGVYIFPNGKQALKGLIMNPTQNGPWAGALRDKNGMLEVKKSLYPNDINKDVLYMKQINFSPSEEGVLLFTPCNDTIFRISSLGIKAAYILKRENKPSYYKNIADITRLNDNTIENKETIGVYDFFETKRFLYIRIYKGDDIYLQQYNKKNGELKSHRVLTDYMECSEAIPGNNIIGLENDIDGGVPFCPEYTSFGFCAQIVSSHIISLLREKGYLKKAPTALLNIEEDDNPVIILYKFKK